MTSIVHRLYSALGFSSFGQVVGKAIHEPLVNVIPRRRSNLLFALMLLLSFLILALGKLTK